MSSTNSTQKPDGDGDVDMLDAEEEEEEEEDGDPNDVQWNADAYVTNANYHVKKMTFLLFINRMFDLPSLFFFVAF